MRTSSPPTDEIVRAARAGDPEAWSELVRRFESLARAVGLGITGDWELARDAAQDAFALALERIGQLRDPAAFPGWFAAIARSAARRRHRAAGPPSPAPPDCALDEDPADAAIEAERGLELRRAIERLPEHERAVIALRHLAELPHAEVAELLGISETASRKRAHDARRRLARALPRDGEPPDAAEAARCGANAATALFAAIRRHDIATVRRLVTDDPGLVDAVEAWGWPEALRRGLAHAEEGTPLIRAAEAGAAEIVGALLAAGAEIDGRCHCAGAETALWTAVTAGHAAVAERLLAAGADPNLTSHSGSTPLHAAVHRAPALVPALLAAGADPAALDRRERSAGDWALLRLARRREAHRDDPAATSMLPTGIRAVDLFAPLRRGGRQYWPPAVKLGQTVLLAAIAEALQPAGTWWIGFAYGPYDATGVTAASREAGIAPTVRLAGERAGEAARRAAFTRALAELAAAPGEKLAIVLTSPGHRHDVALGLAALAAAPSVLATIVVEPMPAETPAVPASVPEGFDTQLALDPRRARRLLYPALDPRLTLTREAPDERHGALAADARATLAAYDALDPELARPDPADTRDPALAARAQRLLHYLRQPFVVAEPFTSLPGVRTPYARMLEEVEAILGG